MSATYDLVGLRQLVDAYACAIDDRDEQALKHLFAPGGTVTAPAPDGTGSFTVDVAGMGRLIESVADFERTFHHVGGAVFSVDGDRATGSVHCSAHHYQTAGQERPVDHVMMIRYLDRYERVGDGWVFSSRDVGVQWTESHLAHRLRR